MNRKYLILSFVLTTLIFWSENPRHCQANLSYSSFDRTESAIEISTDNEIANDGPVVFTGQAIQNINEKLNPLLGDPLFIDSYFEGELKTIASFNNTGFNLFANSSVEYVDYEILGGYSDLNPDSNSESIISFSFTTHETLNYNLTASILHDGINTSGLISIIEDGGSNQTIINLNHFTSRIDSGTLNPGTYDVTFQIIGSTPDNLEFDEGAWSWSASSHASANVSFKTTTIPEPASLSLLALGGLAALRRKRTKKTIKGICI